MAKQSELDPSGYSSVLNPNDLSRLRVWYGIPPDFDIELPRANERVDNLPPGRLAVYEEALWTGLRFPIHPFILLSFISMVYPFVPLFQTSLGL